MTVKLFLLLFLVLFSCLPTSYLYYFFMNKLADEGDFGKIAWTSAVFALLLTMIITISFSIVSFK